MSKITPFLLSSVLLIGLAACNNAKTTADSPNSTNENGQPPATETAQTNKNDATNEVRKKQIESDMRARNQRNDAMGDPNVRADGDIESQVRNKLEANIPDGRLTVDSKDGAVTIAGTVPTQAQLAKVEPLAKQIQGVKDVEVKATVAQAKAN
ncbi:MAG: BON domain-containing protein [Leptolyngbyaceae cyanobacterium RU_5_1]|nr:BON domain-containing protein [Leptolyngbyaceae cyanobacterium RU_5_1]